MDDFNPHAQNASFLYRDGKTSVDVPIAMIDAFNTYLLSISINYGAQLGAAILMLLVTLVMTPTAKLLRRPSGVLHIIILVLCVARMALLASATLSPFNEFYNHWAVDYAAVPRFDYYVSVAGTTASMLLVVFIELALVHQAWTMVTLWPDPAKYVLYAVSVCVTLLTVGWRVAATVVQNRAIMSLESTYGSLWIMHAAVITNAISICWFCALFNIKLVVHLVTNRSVLPSSRSLTPMEVLIMTNGILMVIPVIFSGLEFGQFTNFESASLTLTSVAIVLPLGTLAAQRVSHSYGIHSAPEEDSNGEALLPSHYSNSTTMTPVKAAYTGFPSSPASNTSRAASTPGVSISSRCEVYIPQNQQHLNQNRGERQYQQQRNDPVDIELGRIDDDDAFGRGHVRVDRGFEMHEERI